jgi:negative regulator of flagellin synthesis FlgM
MTKSSFHAMLSQKASLPPSTPAMLASWPVFFHNPLKKFVISSDRVHRRKESEGVQRMKIYNQPAIQQVMKSYGKTPERTKVEKSGGMATDQIQISSQARSFQVAMKAIQEVPEIRQEKVDAIKEQIASGTYGPSAQDIARKMMGRG